MSEDRIELASVSSVPSSATTVGLISAGIGLNGRIVYNDSSSVLYVKFGAVASTSSYTVQVVAQGTFIFPAPLYAGEVDGLWASANGNARITTWLGSRQCQGSRPQDLATPTLPRSFPCWQSKERS